MNQFSQSLRQGAVTGFYKGWSSFLWMMKLMIPISLFTTVIAWTQWLQYLNFLLKPAMGIINLPVAAALPLLMGMLTGVYGGIAAMIVLPLTREQMTLIGIFILTAHNLVQEGIIQGKSGINPFKATLCRIAAAVLLLILLTPWFSPPSLAAHTNIAVPAVKPPLFIILQGWVISISRLTIKAFLIINSLLITLEMLKASGWLRYVVAFFAPILKLMGLGRKLAFLWITAIFFGLAYGGSIIMQESKGGTLSREELETLHLSIGLNHSLVEDTLLLVALGLSPFWLYVPRFLMAVATVHIFKLWRRLRRIDCLSPC